MVRITFVLVATLVLCAYTGAHPMSSRQLLPPKPGYVPVYIRNGDTPLEDINLDLAEAFHAIPSGRSAGRNDILAQRSNDEVELPSQNEKNPPEVKTRGKNDSTKVKDIKENEPNEITNNERKEENKSRKIESEHIQRIAKPQH